ncbi:MAG: Flp pilus assembly complex ATPase component TadA, partial [Elusimicrobia bacterium]|nr:Flp pilus assembly complex ATPase component TadA [Elusimicrobiota bacterium]
MAIDLENLLKLMVQTGISDIHFKAEARPVLRLHGKIISSGNMKVLSREEVSELAMALMNEEQRKIFEQEKELDLAYSLQNLSRFRANVFMQRGSVAVTLRVVPLKVKNFEELNLPKEVLQKLAQEPRGLILFAGITGAGKTTTMNSFLQFLNENRSCRIITIEDPIEYYHQDTKASIVQREVGLDTASFGKALKNVLRQDPDVVVVGEMRD